MFEIIKCEQIWRSVQGFEGAYEVSSQGQVRSLSRAVKHWRGGFRTIPEMLISPRLAKGYQHVKLQSEGRSKQISIHRLVAAAFIPNPLGLPQVNHRDGNKTHNSYPNLEWVSASENNTHAIRSGLKIQRGEKVSNAVLSERDVIAIRGRLAEGETCVSIARDYPVTDRAISRIKRRKVWGHI